MPVAAIGSVSWRLALVYIERSRNDAKGRDKQLTVGLDEGGVELGHLLDGGVALDAVFGHAAIYCDDLILQYSIVWREG